MSKRFLIALLGFVVVVGPLFIYFLYHRLKKANFVRNLLSLPKERRFFWYLLRKSGFEVVDTDLEHRFSLKVNGEIRNYCVKIDFLLKRQGKYFAGVFASSSDERELMKSFFVFSSLYRLEGIAFYYERERFYDFWSF